VGEPQKGDEEAVLLCLCYGIRGLSALVCGVAVAREKAKGGEHVDDMLPPQAG